MATPSSDEISPYPHSPFANNVLDWDIETVGRWISNQGLGIYANSFRENNVTGDVLIHLDQTDLADIGVSSVGHRLRILKAIYNLVSSKGLPLGSNHYIPPTVLEEQGDSMHKMDIPALIHSFEVRDERMGYAENEIRRLLDNFARLREELLPIFRMVKESKPLPTPDAAQGSPQQQNLSPTLSPPASSPPVPSPTHYLPSSNYAMSSQPQPPRLLRQVSSKKNITVPSSSKSPTGPPDWFDEISFAGKDRKASSSNLFKSVKLGLDDPCSKVLPVAMRRYKLQGDWRDYALLVCYDDQERLLGLDEKPLLIFKELQDAGLKPMFMLRQIDGLKNGQSVVIGGTPGGVL